ncbi:alkaline phosphatase family protein, partial [bacterium]|nr:alkaline phosphatase family protein [bacterium]
MTRFARAVARICRPDTPAPSRRLPRRSAFLSLPAGLPALVLIVLLAGCGADPGPEVWVIGLDGADWDLLDPMIEAGELPHLAALRRQGAWGRLRSEPPLISPVLWTTIATGRSPDTHGVAWFMTENADGGMVPVSSAQRRVRSFWNMAADADLTSGVIGWWATYPADPVAGFLISDYVGWHSFGVNGREADDRGKTWPPELMADVRRLLPGPADVPLAQVAAMVHRDPAELVFAADADPYAHPVNHLRQAMATSRGYVDLALTELERGRPDLLAVYFEGTDAVMHLFGDHQPPRQPWIAADEFAAYRDVVAAYWRWQDALLGELLAARGPATTVIVVSDHGFRVGDERRKEDAFHIETADDDHMLDGIVIISGPEVRPGARLEDADIYDVAPTVLHALGLPVGADMPGRVLTAALDPVAVAARPVRSVVTWETTPFAPGRAPGGDATATANLTSMLRSLGYIAGQDDGGEPAASPAEAVNLATVLLRQGRAREAVDRLR